MNQMKTYFFSLLAVTLSMTAISDACAQERSIEKNYRWSYQVNPDVSLAFNNYDCDLVIHTWDKAEVSYIMRVDATLKSEDDARRLDRYIENLEFSHAAGNVSFDNRFWSSKKSVLGKKTIGLKGEKAIRFSTFEMKGELWIPEDCMLNLSSKYSEIELEDLNGRLSLDLYNDKLYAGDLNSKLNLTAKYSTLEFNEMKDIEADLYNTTFEADHIGDLRIVSKYSRFASTYAGKVDIDGYNDKYIMGKVGDIRFTDKYSDLNAEQSGHLDLDCYNSSVNIARLADVDLKSKYGTFNFGKPGNLNIVSAYSDKYAIDSVNSINILESKYCDHKIKYLESSLYLKEGYSDKLRLDRSGQLKEVKVNGKYVEVEMGIDRDLSYRFNADVKYPDFDINEEAMNVRIKIQEGSELKMEAVRGTEREGMLSFFVNGYEMSLTLNEFF